MHVAIVGRDPALRALAAEAFDEAPAAWDVSIHEGPVSDADVIVDLSGDLAGSEVVPFDAAEPSAVIERIRSRSTGPAGPIGVWTPCPGSGSTSVAVHLAACLAEMGSCTLVDLDPRRGAGVRVGCPPADEDISDPQLRARPVAGGFRLVDGPPLPADVSATAFIVEGPADAVLATGCAKHVIVLPSGRSGIERATAQLERLPDRSALVVNRTGWGGELTRAAIARLVGHRIALELPFSPGLRDAEDRRELLRSSFSPWLRRVRRLARAL